MILLENAERAVALANDGFLPLPVQGWLDKDSGEMCSVEDAEPMELFAKIIEEASEAMRDCATYERLWDIEGETKKTMRYRHALGMELTDIKTACTTLLEYIGYGLIDRLELQQEVNEKNKARGYIQEGE